MGSVVFQQIKKQGGFGRSGFLNTRHGRVQTPLFMPVATRAAVKGLEPEEVATTGAEVMLANTYHLHIQPGEKLIRKIGGIHAYNRWNGPILTDSGGYQVFSLSHVRKISEDGVNFKDPQSGQEVLLTPEKSIQIQYDLGSDIIMAFDDLTGLSPGEINRTKEAMERTHRWLDRSINEFQRLTKKSPVGNRPLLLGIIQGGLERELRAKSLDYVQSTSVDGIAIGGLAVGEARKDMYDMLKYLATLYDPQKIHYLMGVGEPVDMRLAIENGIDMFDCVLPTRNGRHGSAWTSSDKKINLKRVEFAADRGVIDKKCDCYTCQKGYSRAFLRHLFKVGDPLAGKLASIHNLRYLNRLCEEYKK